MPAAHPPTEAEKAGRSQGVLPLFLKGAQWLRQAGIDFSAACANLSVGGGIVQIKPGKVIFVTNK